MSEQFSPAVAAEILKDFDLDKVNPHKPVAYVPLSTIVRLGLDIDQQCQKYEARGLCVIVFQPDHCVINSGAFYVYEANRLSEIGNAYADLLSAYGWPITAEGLIRSMAQVWLKEDHPLFGVIREAFND